MSSSTPARRSPSLRPLGVTLALALGLLPPSALTGCPASGIAPPVRPGGQGGTSQVTGSPRPSVAPTGASPRPSDAPTPLASSFAAVTSPIATFAGRVLGLDGQPAPNVLVRGFLVSDAGGGVISNNGGTLITDNGAGLVGSAGAYRLAEAPPPLETRSDANGHFTLRDPQGRALNLEAVQSDDVKALRRGVAADAQGVELQLAPTGTLRGSVTAAGVSDLLGVDVFIPGTSYVAKTDRAGAYEIAHVPAGTHELAASRTGLGKGSAAGVVVRSKETTTAPAIALVAITPAITAVDPPNGGPGTRVKVTGQHFGKTSGEALVVTIGGAPALDVERQDDGTLLATVPDAATQGEVIVRVDGIASAPAAFAVLGGLAFATAHLELPAGRELRPVLRAVDTGGERIAAPALSWAVEGAAAKVDAQGALTALSAGTATLRATSGKQAATLAIAVGAPGVALVDTVVGTGTEGGANGPAASATFTYPQAVAPAPDGGVYITEGVTIRHLRADGVVTQAAGSSKGVQGGPAAAARFEQISGLASDPATGDLYILDGGSYRIRKLSAAGEVTTVAGNGPAGFLLGDFKDGPRAEARFLSPTAFARRADGGFWVVDSNALRLVAADGSVTTVAGSRGAGVVNGCGGVVTAPNGDAWVLDGAACVRRFTPAGEGSVYAGAPEERGDTDGPPLQARFRGLYEAAGDGKGGLFVMDASHRIRRIAPDGTVSTLAGSTEEGDLGGPATAARFDTITSLAVDAAGDLLLTDCFNHKVKVVRFAR